MFKKILISVFTIDLFGSSEVITVCREAMISEVIEEKLFDLAQKQMRSTIMCSPQTFAVETLRKAW